MYSSGRRVVHRLVLSVTNRLRKDFILPLTFAIVDDDDDDDDDDGDELFLWYG